MLTCYLGLESWAWQSNQGLAWPEACWRDSPSAVQPGLLLLPGCVGPEQPPGVADPPPAPRGHTQRLIHAPLLSPLYFTETVAIKFSLQFGESCYRVQASGFTVFAACLLMPVTAPVHALRFPGESETRSACSTGDLDVTGSTGTSAEHPQPHSKRCRLLSRHSPHALL